VLVAAALVAAVLAVAERSAAAAAAAEPTAQTPPCAERLDATYYDPSLAGQPMANGQPYDPRNPQLASSNRHHLGTHLLLRRADGVATVVVEVMDRGSPELGLDLSEAAFQRLGSLQEGRIPVCVEVVR